MAWWFITNRSFDMELVKTEYQQLSESCNNEELLIYYCEINNVAF